MRPQLCELAQRGHVCPDDLCHANDVTLCGFEKDLWDDVYDPWEDADWEDADN